MSQRENNTKFAILGMLDWQSMSGYDIKKFMSEVVDHIWNVSFGQIYPLLKRLEKEGLVKKKFFEQEGRPNKYVYQITKSGKIELGEWLKSEVSYPSIRNELLLKIGMYTIKHIKTAQLQINNYEKIVEEKIAFYKNLLEEKRKQCENDEEMIFIQIIADYIVSHLKCELEWCKHSQKKLKSI